MQKFRFVIGIFLLFFSGISITHAEQKQESLYQAISERVLQAFPLGEQKTMGDIAEQNKNNETEKTDNEISDDTDSNDDDSGGGFDPDAFFKFFTDEIAYPQEFHKKKRSYDILSSINTSQQSIISKQCWDDLNLLYGNREHPHFFLGEILGGKAKTELGKAFFNGLIANPIDDVAELVSRQEIVRILFEDQALHNRLSGLLQRFGKHETFLTGLWGKEQLMQFIKQDVYFSTGTKIKNWPKLSRFLNAVGKRLNKSSWALELSEISGMASNTYSLGSSYVSTAVLSLYSLAALNRFFPVPQSIAQYTDFIMKSKIVSPRTEMYSLLFLLHNSFAKAVSTSAASYTGLSRVQSSWKHYFVWFKYDDFLHKRLAHVAECVRVMKKIVEVVPLDVQKRLKHFHNLDRLFNELPQINNDVKQFLDDLLTPTFSKKVLKSDIEYCFRRGRMYRVYGLLDRIKKAIEPALVAIGELDAYVTTANLLRESMDKSARFCFVDYVLDAHQPSIELHNFWNPFLNNDSVVTNSISLGHKNNVPHMVVTGPNSGGKSTALKAIALSVILAQSLAIAPADSMVLTPFSHVAVYLNIADSIIDKESRFQKEGKQAFAHGDLIGELSKQGKFSLAIFDEIFSGTSHEEGALWGYKTALGFAKYPNCICIIATHFPEITLLEHDTKGLFVNYKVAVEEDNQRGFIRDASGKLQRLYRLNRGVSHQHIAHEVLKEQGEKSQFFINNIMV